MAKPLSQEAKTPWSVYGLFQGELYFRTPVWLLSLSLDRIVDYESSTQVPLPLQTFTDHTLPITSLHIGIGTLSTSRIFSCSLDATVKIWTIDPHTKSDSPDPSFTLLATFDFPHPIGEIAVDPLERYFFAASTGDGGEIFQAQLFTEKKPVRNLANGAHGSIQVSPDKPIVAKYALHFLARPIPFI